eukprot:TRINITY_DN1789_c0_g1_i1.p1 TRINITY_DN1789_c0_g1~~TRINITY_DN1789_c0_g1_i1.p1  ORF type:complete len:1150 (+),score=247.56 TRINITY_DN1789_c0_g1_i1:187-3636(+)
MVMTSSVEGKVVRTGGVDAHSRGLSPTASIATGISPHSGYRDPVGPMDPSRRPSPIITPASGRGASRQQAQQTKPNRSASSSYSENGTPKLPTRGSSAGSDPSHHMGCLEHTVEALSDSPTLPPLPSPRSLVKVLDSPSFKKNGSLVNGQLSIPLPPLESGMSDVDIREAAYEILVGATGARTELRGRTGSGSYVQRPSLDTPPTTTSRLKLAFGLGSAAAKVADSGPQAPLSAMEIICKQLGVTEFSDQRTRKALSRASASQVGRKLENLIAPLELLQFLGPTDFPSQRDFVRWKKRQLAVLEEGLLNSTSVRSDGPDTPSVRLRQVLNDIRMGDLDLQEAQAKQTLRVAVMAKAEVFGTGADGRPTCSIHWADGFPLNLFLYMALLRACFETCEGSSSLVEGVEEVLEQLRKTWALLGLTETTHHLTFAWVLFAEFVSTGASSSLLIALSAEQLQEGVKLFKAGLSDEEQPSPAADLLRRSQLQVLNLFLGAMAAFTEERLSRYRELFPVGAEGVMEHLVTITLFAEETLQAEDVQSQRGSKRGTGRGSDRPAVTSPAQEKAESLIRSSVKGAFLELCNAVNSRRGSFIHGEMPPPSLVSLAVDAGNLAEEEVSLYTPAFKDWCPSAGSVAVATVHACYKRELGRFLKETAFLTPEAAQVLLAAKRLEQQLVEMAVEDAADAEDGGSSVVSEMLPYDTEKVMQALLQRWAEERKAKCQEWVERTLDKEKWNPNLLKERCAPSAVDVMQLMQGTMDSFFELPLPPDPDILVRLVRTMDGALERYCAKVVASVGSKDQFLPPLPSLTRYKKDVLLKAQQALPPPSSAPPSASKHLHGSASKAATSKPNDPLGIPQICCRINTLHFILKDIEKLKETIRNGWENALVPPVPSPTAPKPRGVVAYFITSQSTGSNIPLAPPLPSDLLGMFEDLRDDVEKAISRLCEFAAFKVVFGDLKAKMLESLYVGSVERARIDGVISELQPHLILIVDNIVPDRRDRLVAALLRALTVAFLRVLLAAGPHRGYTVTDAALLSYDLEQLRELFVDGGEGLPQDEVDKATKLPLQILALFACDTDDLIRSFEQANKEGPANPPPPLNSASTLKLPKLPPFKGAWSPTDPYTILRILCYRADRRASKYLKKLFDLPKEVRK